MATLDLFKKNTEVQMGKKAIDLINSNDMISETSMVLGLPTDTPETIKATFDPAVPYTPDPAFFPTIAPRPYPPAHPDSPGRLDRRPVTWRLRRLETGGLSPPSHPELRANNKKKPRASPVTTRRGAFSLQTSGV